MRAADPHAGPGLREALAAWLVWVVVAALVWLTYARLPASDFYNVTGTGFRAGAARVLVLTGWPISIAAVALMAVSVDRLLAAPLQRRSRRAVAAAAVVALVLCATIAWPGVIKQANLDAKPSNALAAAGVLLALGLTLVAVRRTGAGPRSPRRRGDPVSAALLVVIGVIAIPWILANLGFYVGDIPGLRSVYMSKQILPEVGHPHLHAVHLGNHEGLDGWLLAATALALRRTLPGMRATRLRAVLGAYLALVLGYGVMVAANDSWNEQLVKRGWTSHGLPNVITPAPNVGWAILAVAATGLYLFAFRVSPGESAGT